MRNFREPPPIPYRIDEARGSAEQHSVPGSARAIPYGREGREKQQTGHDSCAHVNPDADGFGVRDVNEEEKWKVRVIRDHEER